MEQQGIERVDRNLRVEAMVNDPDIVWHDVREAPFRVYGLYDYREQAVFRRMPQEVAHAVSEGGRDLGTQHGGRQSAVLDECGSDRYPCADAHGLSDAAHGADRLGGL